MTKSAILVLFCVLTIACDTQIEELTISTKPISLPDRLTFVYQSSSHAGIKGWHLVLFSLNNNATYKLTSGPFDIIPAWSPDKREIYFTRGIPPNPNLRIWKMRYNGDSKRALTPPDKNCGDPKVSPDGRSIAFISNTGKRWDIFVMDTSGNNWQQITSSSTVPSYEVTTFGYPSWAPDSKRLIFAFHRSDINKGGLAVLDLKSNSFRHLSDLDSLKPYSPEWSPTHEEFVFVGIINDGKGPKIFRSNASGGNIVQLTDSWGSSAPDWSLDGKEIAYESQDSLKGYITIWIMDRDGTNKRKLIDVPGVDVTEPAW